MVGRVGARWALGGAVALALGACIDRTAPDPTVDPPDAVLEGDASTPADSAVEREDGSASDARADSSEPDGSPEGSSDARVDAGPLGAQTTTLAFVDGLADFDFTASHLAYRVGTSLHTCLLPGCVAPAAVPNTQDASGRFALAENRLFFTARAPSTIQDNVFSVAFDGSNKTNRTRTVVVGGPTISFVGATSLTGGSKVEQVSRWSRSDQAGYKTLFQPADGNSENAFRVGRSTVNLHTNGGAEVRFAFEQKNWPYENPPGAIVPRSITTTGALLPPLSRDPDAVAVSPRGPLVPYPTVAVLENGRVKACPTSTDCTAWRDLGVSGTVISLDAESLYVGSSSGLGACALSEVATTGTCTLAPLVTGEAVADPLYLTPTLAVYRSGSRVRAVTKRPSAACTAGSFRPATGSTCVPCPAGERTLSGVSACFTECPRGTYATGPRSCTPCADGYSTAEGTVGATAASCTTCAGGAVSNATTNHICRDP